MFGEKTPVPTLQTNQSDVYIKLLFHVAHYQIIFLPKYNNVLPTLFNVIKFTKSLLKVSFLKNYTQAINVKAIGLPCVMLQL